MSVWPRETQGHLMVRLYARNGSVQVRHLQSGTEYHRTQAALPPQHYHLRQDTGGVPDTKFLETECPAP